jgi:antitoxin (DNA-binding transcriptional repressor) of toxin-antitoxin stability system
MIHKMKTATIRTLRTQFPRVRQLLAQEGEVVVTERGKPVIVLRPYVARARAAKRVDYYARLRNRMPSPLSRTQREALDQADRGER